MFIRPRPAEFLPELAPPGVETMIYPRWAERPITEFRGLLVHTNGANGTGSVESSFNWTTSNWGTNAMPHYQADLSGRAAKFMPSNRKGICNYQADWFFLSIETADLGWGEGDPCGEAEFTPEQVETISHIIAYEAITHNFPIVTPTAWDGTGVASHTDPFAYPYWTNSQGKACPGWRKKEMVREEILTYANAIYNSWMDLTDEEEDLMLYIIKPRGDFWDPGYDQGNGPAWFIRFASGKLVRSTKPDMDFADVKTDVDTFYYDNKDHYNELLEQSGSTLVPKM